MTRCMFCEGESEVREVREGVELCSKCYAIYQERRKDEDLVDDNGEIEAMEAEEVAEYDMEEIMEAEAVEQQEPLSPLKCEAVIGVREDGSLYFNVGGSDTNLLIVDGLLNFATRRLSQIWAERDAQFKG